MKTTIKSVAFSDLPKLGDEFAGGAFAGITTRSDGSHAAVVRLPDMARGVAWAAAKKWAKKAGGELPSRPVAAMLFAISRSNLEPAWHWTCEEYDASTAWGCGFHGGYQYFGRKSSEGCAVAVRLIPITA